jgi:peptide/nickel transport system substrate-binding protein
MLLSTTDVDFLDPGRTYFSTGIQVASATQRTLYAFLPGRGGAPVPDLASRPPIITDHGRRVTVHLRGDVRFSPPVDRTVTSHDVAYAFDRFFSINVGGQYAGYFRDVVGVPASPMKGVHRIAGVTTPDARTVVFQLREPTSAQLIGALSLPIGAPVPEEYARRFDRHNPSTYNTHVVATGPYMVRNNRAGRTVGYQAGRSIELVRNPSWSRATDRRPAYLDEIRIETNASNDTIAARQVLGGSHRALAVPPPPSLLKRVLAGDKRKFARVMTGGYRFLPLNTTIPPFDNLNVRKAMLAIYDRTAARQARGGPATGPLATHFLPPGIPGFAEAGGAAGPGYDFLSARSPHGDAALATEYMKKAGYPSGRYRGKQEFLVMSGRTSGDLSVAAVTEDALKKLGFRIKVRALPDDALFTEWCSVPARMVLTCGSGMAWLKDFADPQPMLQPVFDGDAIQRPTGNTNYSQLDVPAINAAMAAAGNLRGGARSRAWGTIDRMILGQAAAVPLQWDNTTLVRSQDVAGPASSYFGSWDLAFLSLR